MTQKETFMGFYTTSRNFYNRLSAPPPKEIEKIEAVAACIAATNKYGFIKSQRTKWDPKNKMEIPDTKTIVHKHFFPGKRENKVQIEITDKDREKAQQLLDHFHFSMFSKKMSESMSDFDERLSHILGKDIFTTRDLGMLAALPNSYKIDIHRECVDEIIDKIRDNASYVGEINQRMWLTITVFDIKRITTKKLETTHLIVGYTDDEALVKFFFSHGDYTKMKNMLIGNKLCFKGTVRSHEFSAYTKCKETMFSSIRIDSNVVKQFSPDEPPKINFT